MTTARLTTAERHHLATLLGSWTLEPAPESYEQGSRMTFAYRGPEPLRQGAGLYLHYDTYGHKNQLHCAGKTSLWDGTEHHTLSNHLSQKQRDMLHTSINLSATKSPDQMAKDITRRLLPLYLEAYELARAELCTRREKHRAQRALAEDLAALLPHARVSGGEQLSQESHIYMQSGPTWRISHYSISLEHFGLNERRARLVAALLASEAWENAAG